MVEYNEIIKISDEKILELKNQTLEVFEIKKPLDLDYALHLAKVISKLSPLVGNTIEFFVAKKLNENNWGTLGKWVRQDPDFPDLLFESNLNPMPGYEIKTWFPLSTEMTARFKDSQLAFEHNPIKVCLIVWVPEYIVYGKPIVLDVWIGSGKSLALARDKHYHNPPDYLIFEPEDT
jgi:hypothetical protein